LRDVIGLTQCGPAGRETVRAGFEPLDEWSDQLGLRSLRSTGGALGRRPETAWAAELPVMVAREPHPSISERPIPATPSSLIWSHHGRTRTWWRPPSA